MSSGMLQDPHGVTSQKTPFFKIIKNSSSGMFHRVALVRTDVSEECIASIIRVEIISESAIYFSC
jgi:hypothetical protein